MLKHHRETVDFLRSHGATHIRVEQHGRRHPRLVFDIAGRQWSVVCASSPGEGRAAANLRALLKRLLSRSAEP
jgi:hypothetical protein